MLHVVTIPATDSGMLAVQHVASRSVIEALRSWIPMDHLEIHTVVIRVALDAR